MIAVIYKSEGPVLDGEYIGGQYRWGTTKRLTRALITCSRRPTNGTLTLTLEVGGALTLLSIDVPSAAPAEFSDTVELGLTVAANAWVRWKASFDGLPEEGAMQVSITMEALSEAVVRRPWLEARWVNGQEREIAFYYTAETHGWTATGYAAGRASIAQSGDTSIEFQILGAPVLRVAAGVLVANSFRALGAGVRVSESPRLEFLVGGNRVAAVTGAGVLCVSNVVEAAPIGLTQDYDGFWKRFELWSGGQLTATLEAGSLRALGLEEGL